MFYMNQFKKIDNSVAFDQRETNVWLGDQKGGFQPVIQLTPMGNVKIMSKKKGGHPCCIKGAVVKFVNNKVEDYYGAVEEPRFQRVEFF